MMIDLYEWLLLSLCRDVQLRNAGNHDVYDLIGYDRLRANLTLFYKVGANLFQWNNQVVKGDVLRSFWENTGTIFVNLVEENSLLEFTATAGSPSILSAPKLHFAWGAVYVQQ